MRILSTAVTLLAAASLLAAQSQPASDAKAPPSSPKGTAASSKPSTGAKAAAKPAGQATKGATTLTTQKDKFSYALGMNLAASLHRQGVEVNPNILAQGLKTALTGGKTLLTEQEARAALTQVQMEMQQKQAEKMKAAGDANKKEGDAYLAENKSKPGVVALPSGLQYKVLQAGTGPKPTASDSVVCNYRGTLINGTEFDSSYKRGQPATFPVSGVIKGWTEALQLMPVGSKWQLFIPPSLAYGDRDAGGEIGPSSTLIFEVELMSIQERPKAEEKPAEPKPEDKK